jgi:hypothetical protein
MLRDPYELGRPMTGAEAVVIARRATFDPGQFCPQESDHNGLESLERWQARAVVIALGPTGPSFEDRWSNTEQAVRGLIEIDDRRQRAIREGADDA